MKKYLVIIILVVLAVLVSFLGCTGTESDMDLSGTDTKTQNEMNAIADELVLSINEGLEKIDSGISNNSKILSKFGLTGYEAETVLSENLLNYPWAVSSLVI
jgi:hypothetical protein